MSELKLTHCITTSTDASKRYPVFDVSDYTQKFDSKIPSTHWCGLTCNTINPVIRSLSKYSRQDTGDKSSTNTWYHKNNMVCSVVRCRDSLSPQYVSKEQICPTTKQPQTAAPPKSVNQINKTLVYNIAKRQKMLHRKFGKFALMNSVFHLKHPSWKAYLSFTPECVSPSWKLPLCPQSVESLQ